MNASPGDPPVVPSPAGEASSRGRLDGLAQALGLLSALPLALIVVITFADVFARYLFAAPIRGSVEIIQYAMALVIFTALPLVTHGRGHVTVSLIDKLVRGRVAWLRRVFCDLISLLALVLITWRLWAQGASDLQGDTRTVVLGLPQAPLAYALCVLSALATLLMLGLLWRSWRGEAPVSTGGHA